MFTWDEVKRAQTLRERGIDFVDMEALWDGRRVVEREDTRNPYPERRFIRVGRITGRLFVVGWTPRDGTTRIFSARKANEREEKIFGPLLPE